jgi:hypothetical protein
MGKPMWHVHARPIKQRSTWAALTRVLPRRNCTQFIISLYLNKLICLSRILKKLRWTANGMYSSKSAYRVQFRGSYCSFNSKAIWSATIEGKHKSFLWLLIQNKVLTSDRLLVRNWPCDPVCILCDQAWETSAHLCLHRVYAREVWYLVSNWAEGMIPMPLQEVSTEQWWNGSVQGRPKNISRRLASILMCTAWNIWKERNRRIFQGLFTTPTQIFCMIKDELLVSEVALGGRRSAAPY